MFDATKGNKVVTDQIDSASNTFAALFDELPPRQQLVVLENANTMMSDPDSVSAFTAGTYAQNSSGQPAQVLGAGSNATGGGAQPTPITSETEALAVLMNSPNNSNGVKAALRRLLYPSDPNPIRVDLDGTPVEIVTANRERDAMKTERNSAQQAKADAEQELKDEKDPNKVNSLQHKLDAAQARAATPADSVLKTEMETLLDDLKTDVEGLKTPARVKITGKTELVNKITAAKSSL